MTTRQLTSPQLRALAVISSRGLITSPLFAEFMWPHSAARPGGLNRPAGRMLRWLQRQGLVESLWKPGDNITWRLTEKGRLLLRMGLAAVAVQISKD